MHTVLVLGAGKIGALISGLLAESGAYQVQLADLDETAAAGVARAHGLPNIQAVRLDATDAAALRSHLQSHPVAGGGLEPALSLQCAGGAAQRAKAACITST